MGAENKKRYPDKEMSKELFGGRSIYSMLRDMEEYENSIPDDERIPVDTYGCDCVFLDSFVNNGEDMDRDFTLIARDFLIHEYANVDKYDDVLYLEPEDGESYTDRLIQRSILNFMFNAYRGGSKYTANLFKYLYKTYYKKEYKQLKRFSELKAADILALSSDDEDLNPETIARIITIGEIMGMKISHSCDPLYRYLNDYNERELRFSYFDNKLLDDFENRIDAAEKELYRVFGDDSAIYKGIDKASRFSKKALNLYSFCSDYMDLCDDLDEDFVNSMSETIMFLRKMYPDREFSGEEIATYNELYHAIRALVGNAENLNFRLRELIYGKEAAHRFEVHPPKFNPDEIEEVHEKAPVQKSEIKPVKKNTSESYSEASLVAEIESLRRKLHSQENEIKGLRVELSGKIKLSEENKRLSAQNESDRKELIALRDYVYNLTEDDMEDETKPLQEIVDVLKEQRIIIIGGHPNWVNKMKSYFPDWEYISPSPTGTITASVVDKADKVYFFTDTISHAAYYKYINAVRERNVNFGYIHGVNVEKCIRGIWRENEQV